MDRENPGQGWGTAWVGLAEQETDSELTMDYSGGCHNGKNSQSHRRVCWKVGLEPSKRAALFPL